MNKTLEVGSNRYNYYSISDVEGSNCLPFSLKVLLENVLRNARTPEEQYTMANSIVSACTSKTVGDEIEFAPARVLFQDFTGVPVFVDFAVMREACAELGGDPAKINPQVPCDLVIDHSVIADYAGSADSICKNEKLEHERNAERYEFLKWAQASFENVRIVPPGQGICHQLNIEQFADVVMQSAYDNNDKLPTVYFDTLVGTDSHTPTANGLGVLGWGVGGIEAEAASLGQPITILVPKVIGINLTGELQPGVTAMDVALTFAKTLRDIGVVGSFVECFGPGLASLSATQRATIANMTPEYGSTCTLFPVDARTLEFLRLAGRSEEQVALVEAYSRAQRFYYDENNMNDDERVYSHVIDFNLSAVKPSMAGPSRPHDHFVPLQLRARFVQGCEAHGADMTASSQFISDAGNAELHNGAIAIAAITSCTTATDPAMMIQAGLVARKAAACGLKPKPWVKTIFAPGSHTTEAILKDAGLLKSLEALGFFTCGFGCMSCIGNSGSLSDQMHAAADTVELASVLSGNRNFEGRISPDVAQNYLMSPAYVVLMSIAGTVDFDLDTDPLGADSEGNPVYARDLLPKTSEVDDALAKTLSSDLFIKSRETMFEGDSTWQSLGASATDIFAWNENSTYVRKPTYFEGMTMEVETPAAIEGAVVLAKLGDFITTDHISPAGSMAPGMPATKYLGSRGISSSEYNTYGARRGNHEVMMRGTFGNVKLSNELADGKSGGHTLNMLTGEPATIFDAAMHYIDASCPSIVIAGKMYGSGSSRDWAAKGPALLGVKAVIAESFERIHRSNLIGMGILPLQFKDGDSAGVLGLDGTETYDIEGITFSDTVDEFETVHIKATKKSGDVVNFDATVRIDTPTERDYYKHGGILQYVLRNLASN